MGGRGSGVATIYRLSIHICAGGYVMRGTRGATECNILSRRQGPNTPLGSYVVSGALIGMNAVTSAGLRLSDRPQM